MNLPQLKLLELKLVHQPRSPQLQQVMAFVLAPHNLSDGPLALPTASVGQQNAVTTGSTSVQSVIPSLSVLQSNTRIQDQGPSGPKIETIN